MKRLKTTPDTVGAQLRRAREQQGLSLADVAQRTKIPPHIIAALEEDQAIERLSPVYVRSFLKMYARAVGADEYAILQEFAAHHRPESDASLVITGPGTAPVATPPEPAAWQPPWQPTRPQLMVAGAVVLMALAAWGLISVRRHAPATARRAGPVRAPAAQSARPQVKPLAKQKPATRAPAASPQPASAAAATLTIPAQEPLVLRVVVKDRTWLRVTADGKLIFQSVLEKGASETWTANEALILWLGNAGGVELTLNGRSLGAMGRRGEVIRELKVTHSGVQVKR